MPACVRPAATRCSSGRCWPSSTRPDAGAVVAAGVERVGRRVARRLAALGEARRTVGRGGRGARRRLRAAARGRARRPRPRRRAARGRGAGRRRPARGLRDAALQAPADPGGGRRTCNRRSSAARPTRGPRGCSRSEALRPGSSPRICWPRRPALDPWVPQALREAARGARDQGAPELAAAYLRRALDELPADGVEVARPGRCELPRCRPRRGAPERACRKPRARPAAARRGVAGDRLTPRSRSSSSRCSPSRHAGARRRRWRARARWAGGHLRDRSAPVRAARRQRANGPDDRGRRAGRRSSGWRRR